MKSASTNTFNDGLVRDLNELTTPDKVMTYCLNGTLVTFNGNEFSLQNDMGNARIGTAYLPDGYVPVGMKEYGGIIYVASYNPATKKGQIGSFPSPKRLYINGDNVGTNIDLTNLLSVDDLKGELKYKDYIFDISKTEITSKEQIADSSTSESENVLVINNDYYAKEISKDELHSGDSFVLVYNSYDEDTNQYKGLPKELKELLKNGILTYTLGVLTKSGNIEYLNNLNYIDSDTNLPMIDTNTPIDEILNDKSAEMGEYIQVFNSNYSGSLYQILNYNTFNSMSIEQVLTKNGNTIQIQLKPYYTYINPDFPNISLGKKDDGTPKTVADTIDLYVKKNLSETESSDKKYKYDNLTLTIYPASRYGVCKRLEQKYTYNYAELENGLDNLVDFYYEYKESGIDINFSYQYLQWDSSSLKNITFDFFELDSYENIINNESPIDNYTHETSSNFINAFINKPFSNGKLSKNKIYIVRINRELNNGSKLLLKDCYYRIIYTSPIINNNNRNITINITSKATLQTLSRSYILLGDSSSSSIPTSSEIKEKYKTSSLVYVDQVDTYNKKIDIESNSSYNSDLNIFNSDEICVTVNDNITISNVSLDYKNGEPLFNKDICKYNEDGLQLVLYRSAYAKSKTITKNEKTLVLKQLYNPDNNTFTNYEIKRGIRQVSRLMGDNKYTTSIGYPLTSNQTINDNSFIRGTEKDSNITFSSLSQWNPITGDQEPSNDANTDYNVLLNARSNYLDLLVGFHYNMKETNTSLNIRTPISTFDSDFNDDNFPLKIKNSDYFTHVPLRDTITSYIGGYQENNIEGNYIGTFLKLRADDGINKWGLIDLFSPPMTNSDALTISNLNGKNPYNYGITHTDLIFYIFSQILVPIEQTIEFTDVAADMETYKDDSSVTTLVNIGATNNPNITYNNLPYTDTIDGWKEKSNDKIVIDSVNYNTQTNFEPVIINNPEVSKLYPVFAETNSMTIDSNIDRDTIYLKNIQNIKDFWNTKDYYTLDEAVSDISAKIKLPINNTNTKEYSLIDDTVSLKQLRKFFYTNTYENTPNLYLNNLDEDVDNSKIYAGVGASLTDKIPFYRYINFGKYLSMFKKYLDNE